MSLRINQNVAAINSYRNLANTQVSLGKSLEKLSSGFRINRAADDAAGLVKSEKLRSEVRGSQVAIRNAQDGISFVQTAEGALNEVHAILQRMRELAVDAANSATTDGSAQQKEIDELRTQLAAIGTQTKFAGKTVFADYSTTALTFQVGANAGDVQTFNKNLTVSASALTVGSLSVTTASGASSAIAAIDTAISTVSDNRATLGATQNRFESVVRNLSVAVENLTASESRIRDTDMALEMTAFTRSQILSQAGTAMLAQANAVPQNVLTLLR